MPASTSSMSPAQCGVCPGLQQPQAPVHYQYTMQQRSRLWSSFKPALCQCSSSLTAAQVTVSRPGSSWPIHQQHAQHSLGAPRRHDCTIPTSSRCKAGSNNGTPNSGSNNSNGTYSNGNQPQDDGWGGPTGQQPADPWQTSAPPPRAPPPGPPPPPPPPDSQAARLRQFMQNLGMAAMLPGMAAAAAVTGSNSSNGPSQRQQGAPRATQQHASVGRQPQSPQGGAAGGDRVTDATSGRTSRLRRMMRDLGMRDMSKQQPKPPQQPPRRPITANEINEWGSDWTEDWDPEEDLDPAARIALADQAEAEQQRMRREEETRGGAPRDKWITPLLDLKAVTGAVDPDQERTEDILQGEALANKDESQTAIRYTAQIVLIPLITGFVLSRALADPILNFTLQNNQEAFAMTDRQKVEGAEKVHIEEARLRFDMAIGKLPPLSEYEILEHLREFAAEVQEEERHTNEQNLITVVSDSISSIMLFAMISQPSRGRMALFNTLSRLFDGLSDIAKAVMIILIADTLLGYHSEEGWTGLIELIVGHYGFEPDEEALVIFVGVVPVVIDVFFKYWIFIGLNRISPGAVVTIKQIDTH